MWPLTSFCRREFIDNRCHIFYFTLKIAKSSYFICSLGSRRFFILLNFFPSLILIIRLKYFFQVPFFLFLRFVVDYFSNLFFFQPWKNTAVSLLVLPRCFLIDFGTFYSVRANFPWRGKQAPRPLYGCTPELICLRLINHHSSCLENIYSNMFGYCYLNHCKTKWAVPRNF